MAWLKAVRRFACAMCRTGVSAQRTNAMHDRDQACEDLLKVLVFDLARINAEVLPHDAPDRLKVLFGWHSQAFLCDHHLAHGLKNVACGGNGLPRGTCRVLDSALELLVD